KSTRGNERIKVMNIHHIWLFALQSLSHTLDPGRRIDSAQKSFHLSGKAIPASFRRLTKLCYFMPVLLKHGYHLINHSFLSGIFTVVIMNQKNFHIFIALVLNSEQIHYIKSYIFRIKSFF